MKKIDIPDGLRAYVESQVAEASIPADGIDPLYTDPNHLRISRLTRSAETRSGFIIQRALLEGLRQNPGLSVMNPRAFPLTREVGRELDIHEIDFCLAGVHLPITEIKQMTELDIVIVDHRRKVGTVYEIRRATGRLTYRAMRDTLRKLVGAQMLLRAFIHRELGVWVDGTASYLIVYFNKNDPGTGFPPGMLLTRDNLDAHFGCSVTRLIDAANSLHGIRVASQLVKLVDSMQSKKK